MMKWTVGYYNQQVIDSIEIWPFNILAKYFKTIDLIEEHGAQLGKQLTKPLKDGLFEIRVKSNEGVGRVLFCYAMRYQIIVLHSFIKKTQKTPKKALDIALRRMREVKT